jgi:hypothetical protein
MMKSVSLVKDEVYTHVHHIVPKHAGGTDDPSNLVELTIEDHAIAHRMLWKLYGRKEDWCAWTGLSGLDEENRRAGCSLTQDRLWEQGRHNFQKEGHVNPAHTDKQRKMHSKRMKGNNLGSLINRDETYRSKQADGARGNTNVRGTVWVVNDIGKRRRVKPDQIPEGYQRVAKA